MSAILLLAVSLPSGSCAQPPTLARRIEDHARKHGFSGTVLVARRSSVLYRGTFGLADRGLGVPIRLDTKFKVASITKVFTAVLILQLVDEGRVDLEAPIRRYLPGYSGEGADRVTIHQLLNHTSGIANFDQVKSYEEAVTKGIEVYQLPHTSAQLLSEHASGKLVSEPGKTFDYNNADYVILGKIIERVSGLSYDQALAQRILEPLGLRSSGMLYQRDVIPGLARTYFKPDSVHRLINDMPVYAENWYAAGSMYSTADDLLAFARALFDGRLLRPASLRRMIEPGLDEYGYGLWVSILEVGGDKHRVGFRPGRIMGANVGLFCYFEDDLTVIILGNTNLADVDAFGFAIGRMILE